MTFNFLMLGFSLYFLKHFYEQREASLINWEWDRYHRMFLFWTVFGAIKILTISTSVSGLDVLYTMLQTASTMLSMYYLYMVLYEY